jgi:DNA-binding transcriptional ArsR family regulator
MAKAAAGGRQCSLRVQTRTMPKRISDGIELLADPTRRQIVALIALKARRPSELAREIGLSRPAISRQLRILVEAGLLRRRWFPADRRGALYMIEHGAAGPIIAWLVGVEVGVFLSARGR